MRCCALLLAVLLAGCASIKATEQQQLAYRGKGPNPCLFGGVSPRADEHCREVREGLQGALQSLNERVLGDALDCNRHVARIREALWERSDLEVRSIFSCPDADVCHVSALVMARAGEAYVLDNGGLLKPDLYPGAVASFGGYMEAARGKFWFHPPFAAEEKPPAPAVPVAAAAARRDAGLRRRR